MRALSAMELLHAWERASALPPVDSALALLEAADDQAEDDPAQYPLGERDARLMSLRESVFGREARAIVRCPACAADLEVGFDLADLRATVAGCAADGLTFSVQGYEGRFRLPNSTDLRALSPLSGDPSAARRQLLARCVVDARCDGETVGADALPEAVREAISRRMTEADPQAFAALRL